MNLNSQKGYSMVEMLTVIFILGILAAVAIPKYLSLQEETLNSACQSNMNAIESAFLMKYSKAILGDANTDFTSISLVGTDFVNGNVPDCPEDGSAYTVTPAANGTLTVVCPNGHVLP